MIHPIITVMLVVVHVVEISDHLEIISTECVEKAILVVISNSGVHMLLHTPTALSERCNLAGACVSTWLSVSQNDKDIPNKHEHGLMSQPKVE